MARAFADIAFTPAVQARQEAEGSRSSYARFEQPHIEELNTLGPEEVSFIEARDGFFQATVSETGWPYVQFRGGPAGFLKVLNDKTIGYADFRGNRQYISSGNLTDNDRVSLILMDYPNRRRLKIWARATQVSAKDDPELIKRLQPGGYRALPERAVLLAVEALDWNCPQHIPQRYTLSELEPQLDTLRTRIFELEQENAGLKECLANSTS
ncbi:pyridoxamine 5'-phosphate oxidase family protein [Roseibium algae]|uniref:Pyridoxamine 5'-phosphate oxidase family protein n=1 Tax=Roseibium algae TaxID=3123038 RepID=A0ABU8TJ05_9HYPH